MTTKNTIITAIICFLVGALLALGTTMALNRHFQPVSEPLSIKSDTLSTKDTIPVIKPQIGAENNVKTITVTLWRTVMDSTAIRQRDSVLQKLGIALKERDSLQLILQEVQREYENENYHAWVSGIDPKLDSIKLFHTTTYIQNYVKEPVKYKPKFTFGIQGGVGVIIPFNSGIPNAGGYIGIGGQYTF